jgi:transposase
MSTSPVPEAIDRAEIHALIARTDPWSLGECDGPCLRQLLALLLKLIDEVELKKTTIHKLERMLFGPSSETRLHEPTTESPSSPREQAEPETNPEPALPSAEVPSGPSSARRGHGRLPASRFPGAVRVGCKDPELQPGSACPECFGRGRLYDTGEPSILIKRVGQPIVSAVAYERQVVRCSFCQQRFRASLPDGVEDERWDPTADVAIAIHKYGMGVPFYRLSRLQASFEVPLPASTAFERCENVADALLPVLIQFEKLAATAELFTVDDTRVLILDMLAENKRLEEGARRGMFTTGILAKVGEHRIALYYSGRRYSGENLARLLEYRPQALGPPITMGDAIARNWPPGFVLIVAKCLVHGRRQFVDIESSFPQEAGRVLDDLATVYRIEAQTASLSPEERLAYHQRHSGPVMEALRVWLEMKLEEAEPNSSLGPALRYLKRHWEGLTQYLRTPGCPLDSNSVEQALKLAVLNRKNAYFYKTQHGADVGDLLTSVIKSCQLAETNVWAYLVDAVKNRAQVRARPAEWLPWAWAERSRAQEKPAA